MTTRRSHRRGGRLLAFSAAAVLIAAACGGGGGDDEVADEATETEATQSADDDASGDVSASDDGDQPAPEVTTAPIDEDTSDGSPLVVTIPPDTAPDPVTGGTLRYGLTSDVDGLNPTTSALSAPGLLMGNAVFDTLATFTPDGRAVPWLAESFSSDDNIHWTVTLRPGISFHDGTPLNAEAIVVNFESQRNAALVGLAVRPYFPETDAITIVDDLTVTFNLLEPDAYFPANVAAQLGMVASPAWLEAALADPTLNQQPVGTGPFVFDSRSEDSVTRFVRNEDYWAGEVYLDAVEFYPIPDSADRVDQLFGGELDAIHTTDNDSVLQLRDDDSIQNVLDDAGEESFSMLNSSAPPFDDIRARQALTLSTPRQNYIDLIGLGAARGADQMFIPESPFYNPDVKQLGDDPDAAAPLVAEYCAERGSEQNPITGTTTCTDGKINIELQWSGPSVLQTRIAELLDEGWSAHFNVTFDELLEDEHIQQTAFGQYNVNTWRQFGAPDPAGDRVWLMCRNIGGISLNWPRYCDEERDALILAAQAETDTATRQDLYRQLSKKINEDYLYIFYIHTMWDNAFADYVRGVCDRTSPEGELLACATNGRTFFNTVWLEG